MGLDHDFFSRRTLESNWLAGLIAADGCIVEKYGAWTISQSGNSGEALVQAVREMIGHRATFGHSQPPIGQVAHSIYVPSKRHVADLSNIYGIEPRKTLTYRAPTSLTSEEFRAFMRGYIEGDGCIGFGMAASGNPYLILQYVGTHEFARASAPAFPGKYRTLNIARCKNLMDIRWNGQQAWIACEWLFGQVGLPSTRKSEKWEQYRREVLTSPPAWMVSRQRKAKVAQLLASGTSIRRTAKEVGITFQTVHKWKADGDLNEYL